MTCVGEFQSIGIENLGNTYNLRMLWNNRFFTTEPESIKVSSRNVILYYALTFMHCYKVILATDFSSFEKGTYLNSSTTHIILIQGQPGPIVHKAMSSVLGTGVFNSDGKYILNWKSDGLEMSYVANHPR
jgi:hypothetical protein